jgi:YegS/Rv2252/BmrU family lipid kinase
MPTHKIIVNPVSGRGNGAASIPLIRQLLGSHNLQYDLVQTLRPWHAAELAEQAVRDSYEVIVSVGGDGTANEVLNGLMRAQASRPHAALPATMGILCVGRGNDFAYGMGLPSDLESGCQVLAHNRRRTVDIGRVSGGDFPHGRYFGNGVGIGFDAVVGFEALKMKRLSGFPSYIVAALKTIFLYYQAPEVQILFDGQDIRLRALMVSVMNGRRMGGGFRMAPAALQDDGLFDLCIAEQVSRARIFSLIPHFMRGTQASQREVRTAQARRLTVQALQGSLPVHADGETICTHGVQLTLEILPQQIEMVCQPLDEA